MTRALFARVDDRGRTRAARARGRNSNQIGENGVELKRAEAGRGRSEGGQLAAGKHENACLLGGLVIQGAGTLLLWRGLGTLLLWYDNF